VRHRSALPGSVLRPRRPVCAGSDTRGAAMGLEAREAQRALALATSDRPEAERSRGISATRTRREALDAAVAVGRRNSGSRRNGSHSSSRGGRRPGISSGSPIRAQLASAVGHAGSAPAREPGDPARARAGGAPRIRRVERRVAGASRSAAAYTASSRTARPTAAPSRSRTEGPDPGCAQDRSEDRSDKEALPDAAHPLQSRQRHGGSPSTPLCRTQTNKEDQCSRL
jgi:hypothetical protein